MEKIQPPTLNSHLEDTKREESSTDVRIITQEDSLRKGHPVGEEEKSRTIFVSNIPEEATEEDFQYYFEKFGVILAMDLKEGLDVCIQFATHANAIEAIKEMHSQIFMGKEIMVCLHPSESSIPPIKEKMEIPSLSDQQKKGRMPQNRRTEHRLIAHELDSRVSWQDLKDFGRNEMFQNNFSSSSSFFFYTFSCLNLSGFFFFYYSAGDVNYTNVYTHQGNKIGVIEYFDNASVKRALKELNDKHLYSKRIFLEKDRGQMDFVFNQPRKRLAVQEKKEMRGPSAYTVERPPVGSSRRQLSSPPPMLPSSYTSSSHYRPRSPSSPPSQTGRYVSTYIPPSALSPHPRSSSPRRLSPPRRATSVISSSYRRPPYKGGRRTRIHPSARSPYRPLPPPPSVYPHTATSGDFSSSSHRVSREGERLPPRYGGGDSRPPVKRSFYSTEELGGRSRGGVARYTPLPSPRESYISPQGYDRKTRRRSPPFKSQRNSSPLPSFPPPPPSKYARRKEQPYPGGETHPPFLESTSFKRVSRGYPPSSASSYPQAGPRLRKNSLPRYKRVWQHNSDLPPSPQEEKRCLLPRRSRIRRSSPSPPATYIPPLYPHASPPTSRRSYGRETAPPRAHTVEERRLSSPPLASSATHREGERSPRVLSALPSDSLRNLSCESLEIQEVDTHTHTRPDSVAYSTPREDTFSPEDLYKKTVDSPPEILVEPAHGLKEEETVDKSYPFPLHSPIPLPGIASPPPSLSPERPPSSPPPTFSQRTSSVHSQVREEPRGPPHPRLSPPVAEARVSGERINRRVDRRVYRRPEWRGDCRRDRRGDRRVDRRGDRRVDMRMNPVSPPFASSDAGMGASVRSRPPLYTERAPPMSTHRGRSASFSPPLGRSRRNGPPLKEGRMENASYMKKNYSRLSAGGPSPLHTSRRQWFHPVDKSSPPRFASGYTSKPFSSSPQPSSRPSGHFVVRPLSTVQRRGPPRAPSQRKDIPFRGRSASPRGRHAPPLLSTRGGDDNSTYHAYGISLHRRHPSSANFTTHLSMHRNAVTKSSGYPLRSSRSPLPTS
ncbi:hypothetical protein IE077_001395 [Cardiosporidium cionae]|uniref:RRM domain-containing protein n=1 Tax=Cardiosporidium cionae TaxID=476202 RepID=A0ABQ7JD07_9APIC|nr:hypothetical protein IE077_001395 [Cardiosporidium cionae]|eukprot:KAF8821902.1 hypothetical protein IE077_001395 [Cardiosporidium cionae]